MYPPVTGPTLGLFTLLLVAIFIFIEIGLIQVAYERLGLSHRVVSILMLAMIFGSYINLPITEIPAQRIIEDQIVRFWGIPYVVPRVVYRDRTVIAINLGGALIPLLVCMYLLWRSRIPGKIALATAAVSVVVYRYSQAVPGVGIAVPTLLPGILAAILASLIDRQRSPVIAYVAGTLGCLLGADIFNLPIVADLRAPIASIGGAGTFDGVFVSGLIAVLLA
jgi:uncharacterized membrane protein